MKKCGMATEVYSRVCGYFRPVANWNKGKQSEFAERVTFKSLDGNKSRNGKTEKNVLGPIDDMNTKFLQ